LLGRVRDTINFALLFVRSQGELGDDDEAGPSQAWASFWLPPHGGGSAVRREADAQKKGV
jgi:hypothetical protein